jgi:hypothetical protein
LVISSPLRNDCAGLPKRPDVCQGAQISGSPLSAMLNEPIGTPALGTLGFYRFGGISGLSRDNLSIALW